MKRLTVVLAALSMAAAIGAQELKIGTIDGMSAYGQLVATVLKDAGFDAKIAIYQQPELYQALGKGEIDGAFFLAQPIIAQIKGSTMVSVRLLQTNFCAVTLDPAIKIANPGDLRKYTVGIVKDNSGHAAITRGLTPVEAASDIEQFKMLASGKIQVAVAVDKLIPPMCKAAGIKDYYIQPTPLLRTPTFFALSSKQSSSKGKIEEAFKKWQDSGQWEAEVAKIEKPR